MKYILNMFIIALAAMVAFDSVAQTSATSETSVASSQTAYAMEFTNKGYLLPRIALSSSSNSAPFGTHITGMSVYNVATNADVVPGYYFNNGSKWLRILSSEESDKWISDLNARKVYLANLSDSTPRPAGNQVEITDGGNIGVGESNPITRLSVNGYLKLGGVDNTADMAPSPGMIRFNSTSNKFQGYVRDTNPTLAGDQAGWVDLN